MDGSSSLFSSGGVFGMTRSADTTRDPQADTMRPRRGVESETKAHNQRCIEAWTSHLVGDEQAGIQNKLTNILNSNWWRDRSSLGDSMFQWLVKDNGECWICLKNHGSKIEALKHVKRMLDFESQ